MTAYGLGSIQVTLTLGGVLTAACFFFFAWLETQKTFLKITPISTYFVWQGFALGLAAIFSGTEVIAGTSIYLGPHFIPPHFLGKGYIIGLIGTLPLHAGLQWLRPKDDPDQVLDPSRQELGSLLPSLFVTYWAGIISLSFAKPLAFLGMAAACFQFSGHAALLGFILIPQKRLQMSELMRTTFLVAGTAILFAASTRAGSKMYLMLAMVGLLFYVLQSRTLRKHALATAATLIFLYLTVVAPTVNESRKIQYRDKIPHMQALIEAFTLYSPLYTGRFDGEFYQEQLEGLFSRQFECSAIGAIAEEVELKGFIGGETFYQIRYFFIPRIMWPDKPMITRGAWFTSYLGTSAREADSTVSVGMEAAGELYWNFGFPGVIFGMFILGVMFGIIWRMSGPNPALQPLHMTLYMLNTLTMMNLPEAASRMASCIAIMLFFGVLFKLMRPHRRTKMMSFQRVELPHSAQG